MKHRSMRPLGSRFSAKKPKVESVVVALAATAVLPGFFAARPALAQQSVPVVAPVTTGETEPLVSLDLRDARLEQAIALLAQKSGFNIVTEQASTGKPYGLVNVKLEDKPVSVVLRAIASAAGAVVVDEDGIYHLRPRTDADANPAPKPLSPPSGEATVPVPTVASEAPRPRKATQLAKIKLNFLTPIDFIRNLDDPTWLAFVQSRPPEALPLVQFKPISDTSINILNVPQGGSVPSTPPSAPAAPASGTAGTTAGRDGDTYSSAGQRGLGGQRGGFGGGGQGFGAGGQGFGGQPGGGQPGGLGGQNGGQASLRPAGIQNLIASDADNSLIVDYDDVEDLQRLREIVKLLDVAPKQVVIKAEFVSVGIQDADSFGVDWNITAANNINAVIPPAAGTTPTITLAYASGNAVANLRAALTRNTSNILQAPIISTTNNRLAQINVQHVVTIFVTQNIATNNGIISNSTPVAIPASNGLLVTPHINGDNSITMTLSPQLQTVSTTAAGGFIQDSQALTTTRRVQNGETMVLGGFITKNETIATTKVPFLSDLPIIGNLFTQRDRTVNGSEVLVFVTPTIIEDRAQGTVGTGNSVSPAPTP